MSADSKPGFTIDIQYFIVNKTNQISLYISFHQKFNAQKVENLIILYD
jgi:hypothetical protein